MQIPSAVRTFSSSISSVNDMLSSPAANAAAERWQEMEGATETERVMLNFLIRRNDLEGIHDNALVLYSIPTLV